MKDITPILTVVVSFAITAILGCFFVPFLHKLKYGQMIRQIGPSWHKSKQGTPTMGGIMMVIGILFSLALAVFYSGLLGGSFFRELHNAKKSAMLFSGIGFSVIMGGIGFLDDYIKVVKKRNLGLTVMQKTVLQTAAVVLYLVALAFAGMDETWIPFVGFVDITRGAGLIFWPIAFFFAYGFVNAVNLTDGIDGLNASVTLVVCCAFMVISGFKSQMGLNAYAAAVAGSCAGFLVWNAHPAKVFMGDTGSLLLGGAAVSMAFSTQRPILLLPIGIVYLCEALSVVLQVASFKLTGKRIFKMSPIHHHFEMCGWSEEKIVIVFSAVALIGSLCAVLPTVLPR